MTDELRQEPQAIEEKARLLVARGEYEACVELGNAAIPTLLKHLQSQRNGSTDKVSQVRERLINVLGTILGDREEQRKLVRLRRQGNTDEAEPLMRTRTNVATHIAEYLTDEDVGVRVAAINALLQVNEPNVGVQLLPMLDDENVEVQVTTIQALEGLGYQDAFPCLMDKLGNRTFYIAEEFLSALPAVRVCDQALRALLNLSEEVSLVAFLHVFAEGDRLLQVRAADGLGEVRTRIQYVSTPRVHIPPYSPAIKHETEPKSIGEALVSTADSGDDAFYGVLDDKATTWSEVVASFEQRGITRKLGEMLADSSPILEQDLIFTLVEEMDKFWLEVLRAENLDREASEAAWRDTQQQFVNAWQLPVSFYAVKALAAIETLEAMSLLNSALENPDPVIRAEAAARLGSWLADFPDSGWTRGGSGTEVFEVSQETYQLRDDVVRRLIVLLDDDALINTTAGLERVNRVAAKALKFSGTETAKLALESWNNSGQSLDDTTVD